MARLAFTADLHLGITHAASIARMVEELVAYEPDAVIVAGDLGEPLSQFEGCLDLLRPLACPVGIVAGNHDVWVTSPRSPHTSQELFFQRLPAAVRRRGFVWLEADNLVLPDGVAVAGSVGWYDYSYRPAAASTQTWTDEQMAAAKTQRFNDAHYIDWPYTDPQFAKIVGGALEGRVAALAARDDIREIVVATHMPVFEEQLQPRVHDDPVTSSYFANLTLGAALRRERKVTTVVSGHTHREVPPQVLRRGRLPGLTVTTLPADYGHPRCWQGAFGTG